MTPRITIYSLNFEGYTPQPYDLRDFCFPYYSFAYFLEGEALIEVEGRNILHGPGQFVLVPENQHFQVKYFKDVKVITGNFSLADLKDASHPALHSDVPITHSFWFDDAVFMGALLQRMFVAFTDRDKGFLQSGLDLILTQLHGNNRVAAIPEKFLQLVFADDKAPLSVSEYAQALNVTANYLNKTVKAHTHRTAIDWIEIARLNLAKKLLKDQNLSVLEVAVQAGVEDQSYFSRFFKKQTGMTPSEYRKSLK